MSFDWGNWTDSNSKIDLNPTTPIGFGSEAPKFDPDKIESNEDTQKVVESMSGEQDTGDKDDEVLCSVHCKVYNLEKGKYVERGRGKVNVNKLKTEGEDGKVRGRILCRRDTIMTMLINAPILKDMKFEKDGKFVRFGVVEKIEKKEKDTDGKDDEEEDSDLTTEIKTYLIRPTKDVAHTDVLLSKIKEIQDAQS